MVRGIRAGQQIWKKEYRHTILEKEQSIQEAGDR